MNPETIESLLLDRALGELSPPVAALLEEHLARNPAAAQHAAALEETTQLAGISFTESVPQFPALAKTDRQWIRRAAWQARWRANLIGLAKLAACLALGVFLGRALGPRNASAGPSGPAAIVAVPMAAIPTDSHPKFWSLARRAAVQRSVSPLPGSDVRDARLLWPSPFKMPRVEDKP